MQPRPPHFQRPPPNQAFSPRPATLNQPQSPLQHRPEVIHPRPAPPPVAPTGRAAPTQEGGHQPVPNLINKGHTGTLSAQLGSPKSTDDNSDTSSLFGAVPTSASEKAGLPLADVLFGSGPSSTDFFRQPPAPIKYTPIQRRSVDTHRQPDKLAATTQKDVDSLFSSPAAATITTQQDVGSLFTSPATVAVATIYHQETHSDKTLPENKSITRIPSPPFRSTDVFSLRGSQESRSSQPAPIFDPPTAASQSMDVSAESNAISSATPQRASPTNHHETPLSPTDPVVSALSNNNRGSFDVDQNTTETKVFQALHHQDSSSLFGGSDDTDASHFFSGPSAMDSTAFFSGLSQPGSSAAHIGTASSTTATANNDAFQPIISSVPVSSAEFDRTVELTASRDMGLTLASHAPVQSAAATVTRNAVDLFGQPLQQDFFASSFFNNNEKQDASETTATMETSTDTLHDTFFSNLERSTVDRAGVGSNAQPKETQHDTDTVDITHAPPVSLRESQRPPPSFRDTPSSLRHDKPQAPNNAREVDSLFEQPLGSEQYQAPHQHAQHDQLAQARGSSDAQGVDEQPTPISEEAKPSRPHDHQSKDSHHQYIFAAPVQELPHHAPSFVTQELHRHQESVSDLFSQASQPFGLDNHGSDDRQPSISYLFSQPSQSQALDMSTPKNRQQSVSDLFDMVRQTFAVDALKPEGRQQSVSDLFDMTPQSYAFDNPESENRKQSLSEQLNQELQPFTVDNHKSEDHLESASNQLHKASQPFSFGKQGPTSFDFLGTSYAQEISTFDLLGTSHTQGQAPFDLLGTPNTEGESPLDLLGTSDIHGRSPFDLPETSKIQGGSPFDLLGTSSTQGGTFFDTVEPQSNELPMEPSWPSQDPEHNAVGVPASAPPKSQQRALPATFSFNNQFEEVDNSFTSIDSLSEQVAQPPVRPPQPSNSPPPQQSQSQPIPFDETLPSPTSPGFGRNATGSFVTHDIHAAEAIVQPGSYSIMELSSELAHTQYFSQARESPRLQERANWSKTASGSGATELSQGMSPKVEVETSVFDQVSLAEDAPGTASPSTNVTSATSPPTKERSLASLLDPSTLSAVEDLLNMPKSAAFERGMSRLFKGVKSSATSMFTSPLGQSPSKSLATLGASSADAATPATGETGAVLTASVPSVSAQPTTAPPAPAPAPATTSAPPVATVLPPPPRRTQEKDHSKLQPPPRISNWPATPDAAGAPTMAAAPMEASQPVKFDWAHKQSSMFLESTEEAVPERGEAIESLSNVGREEPSKELDDVPKTLSLQSTTMHTPTAPPAFPTASEQSFHFNHAALSQGSQRDSAQYHPVPQGHGAVDISAAPEAHVDASFVGHRESEDMPGDPVDLGGQKINAHMKWESPNVAVSKQGLGLASPSAPHHTTSPPVHHHLAVSPTLHPRTASPALHHHHQQATSPTLQHQSASPTLLQRTVSPTLLHHAASPTLLQRAISPSVLDPEVLLRKQAAVHALLADQVAHGGSTGVGRTKPDKKERLLEKARELLEKRQQSSGVHLQGSSGGHSGPTVQKYSSAGSRSSGEWMRQEESPRRRSLLSRDQYSSPTISHQLPTLHNEPVTDPVPVPYQPASPSYGAHQPQQQQEQQQPQQQTQQQVDEVMADRHLALENERLREQVRLLLAETSGLQVQIQSQEQLQFQVSRLQEDLTRIHSESQAAEARHLETRSDHSRRLDDVSLENHRLQAALAQAQADHHHVGTGMDDLVGRYRQLEAELGQARQICKEQETALVEAQMMKEVALENERLQYELDRTQRELQEQRAIAAAAAAAASETNARRTSMASDEHTHTAEQLLQEAEGLRRQLKGQRQEMKELQDSVKRSDAEKRDLFSRIGQLEHALEDADKHRNEQKSHQAMKDEAYKVIQERLVASFEEEKAQYLDEEAFKMAKLEHQYNLLQSEMAALRGKETEKSGQETDSTLSRAEEEILKNRVTQLELDLTAARVSEKELGFEMEESIRTVESLKQAESNMRLALAEIEERSSVLREELEIARKEAADRGPSQSDVGQEQSSALESLTEELQLSLGRERLLKKELELASQVMKDGLVSGTHEGSSGRDDFELSRLAENASRWQEECFAAKEETMRVEDQLQRSNLELMAAKTEILQLEANLGADESSSPSTAALQQEVAELRERVTGLLSDIQARDAVLDELRASRQQNEERTAAILEKEMSHGERVSALQHQLEHQQHENSRLDRELLESRALLQEAHATIAASLGSNQSEKLQALLEEERHMNRSQVEGLEGQSARMRSMMLEKQAEIEQVMVDLDSATHRLSAMDQELNLMKAQKAEEQEQRVALEESLLQSNTQRDEEAARQDLLLEQARAQQEDLINQLSILEESKRKMEMSLHEYVAIAETSKREASSFKSLAEKLEQDLITTTSTVNCAQKDDELLKERETVDALKSEMSAKEAQLEQAKEHVSLIADLFRKLLSPSEDPEELEAKESMMTLLAGLQPLGVSVQALPLAGVRFLGMQKEIIMSKTRIEDLESQLSTVKNQQQQTRHESEGTIGTSEESSEVDRLRQELTKAEHGIGKLQQFLQEFQNEKKRAIYELQQRLEESEDEVAQTRSQLAKAQALMLSRPAGSLATAAGSVQSPDMSQAALDRMSSLTSSSVSIDRGRDQAILRDETFKGTEAIHHEAVLALEPLRQQKAELERTLLDLRHRYELSQKENDTLLSGLEKENKVLKSKVEMRSPDMADEHLERIRELELEQVELNRQLKTAQRELEFTRQDMRSLKALAKLRTK
ncbi:hypothetical protein KI688_011869 [Linnemannia hyalina]|uniref:Uncharacterized protein n=1 Tax=Linnemannia hyalina TaxID=64524 RepID=A0A9P8BTI4_9FUNG|nr:hypothetical protein KI688_011869 [Linnemannia hyalina]